MSTQNRPRLYLNHISSLDWLIALEFGRIDDGQPPENWRGVSEQFGYMHEHENGPCVGFEVLGFSDFDPEEEEVAEIWDGPRFIAPQLGLSDVAAGEIVVAAQAFFGDVPSVNRFFFEAACTSEGEEALGYWQDCLEAGDCMAHFALGYTLYGLGRFREAYRHLRFYAEIAPAGAWNWCWYGKGAEAIGELEEAQAAYERAIELEEAGDQETDAPELLAELDARS